MVYTKIITSEGVHELVFVERLKILMYCSICKKWVVPDKLEVGKAHIYGVHCGVAQELACVAFFKWDNLAEGDEKN